MSIITEDELEFWNNYYKYGTYSSKMKICEECGSQFIPAISAMPYELNIPAWMANGWCSRNCFDMWSSKNESN